jgi:hypothetical protein
MADTEAIDFYNEVMDSEEQAEEYTLEHEQGYELTVELTSANRKDVLDEINKLPEEMLSAISEADEGDEADVAEEQNMLANVDGDTVDAFEKICAMGMQHDKLTSHHFEDMAEKLDFEVLFEMGARIIEFSLDESTIKDFHEVDSDKSS